MIHALDYYHESYRYLISELSCKKAIPYRSATGELWHFRLHSRHAKVLHELPIWHIRLYIYVVLMIVVTAYGAEQLQTTLLLDLAVCIASTEFTFSMNHLGYRKALEPFIVHVQCIISILPLIVWPVRKSHTNRSRYGATEIVATCIVLRRIAVLDTPIRMRKMFGKHNYQLSKILWKAIDQLSTAKWHLIPDISRICTWQQHQSALHRN